MMNNVTIYYLMFFSIVMLVSKILKNFIAFLNEQNKIIYSLYFTATYS